MQRPNNKPQQPRRRSAESGEARVVDMRAWKTRKKLQRMKGSGGWTASVLFSVASVLVLVGACLAIAGCVPFAYEVQCLVASWFFATLGGVAGLWLHAVRHRFSMVLMTGVGLTMAVALLAALVKVFILPH